MYGIFSVLPMVASDFLWVVVVPRGFRPHCSVPLSTVYVEFCLGFPLVIREPIHSLSSVFDEKNEYQCHRVEDTVLNRWKDWHVCVGFVWDSMLESGVSVEEWILCERRVDSGTECKSVELIMVIVDLFAKIERMMKGDSKFVMLNGPTNSIWTRLFCFEMCSSWNGLEDWVLHEFGMHLIHMQRMGQNCNAAKVLGLQLSPNAELVGIAKIIIKNQVKQSLIKRANELGKKSEFIDLSLPLLSSYLVCEAGNNFSECKLLNSCKEFTIEVAEIVDLYTLPPIFSTCFQFQILSLSPRTCIFLKSSPLYMSAALESLSCILKIDSSGAFLCVLAANDRVSELLTKTHMPSKRSASNRFLDDLLNQHTKYRIPKQELPSKVQATANIIANRNANSLLLCGNCLSVVANSTNCTTCFALEFGTLPDLRTFWPVSGFKFSIILICGFLKVDTILGALLSCFDATGRALTEINLTQKHREFVSSFTISFPNLPSQRVNSNFDPASWRGHSFAEKRHVPLSSFSPRTNNRWIVPRAKDVYPEYQHGIHFVNEIRRPKLSVGIVDPSVASESQKKVTLTLEHLVKARKLKVEC